MTALASPTAFRGERQPRQARYDPAAGGERRRGVPEQPAGSRACIEARGWKDRRDTGRSGAIRLEASPDASEAIHDAHRVFLFIMARRSANEQISLPDRNLRARWGSPVRRGQLGLRARNTNYRIAQPESVINWNAGARPHSPHQTIGSVAMRVLSRMRMGHCDSET